MELCIGGGVTIYGLELNTLRDTAVDTNIKDIRPVQIDEALLNVEVLHIKNGPTCGFSALIDVDRHL